MDRKNFTSYKLWLILKIKNVGGEKMIDKIEKEIRSWLLFNDAEYVINLLHEKKVFRPISALVEEIEDRVDELEEQVSSFEDDLEEKEAIIEELQSKIKRLQLIRKLSREKLKLLKK